LEKAQAIHNRMLGNISDEHDKSIGSFIYDATKPAAIEFETKAKEIQAVQDKLDVENLKDEELERFVSQRTGVERKRATKATGEVIISGTVGASISKGDFVSTDTISFISLEDKAIDVTGLMNVRVECEKAGAIGNVPANAITNFPVTLQGLINVHNPSPFTNGYEAESDMELIQRYYDKLQRPGKAGNKYHYLEWAKAVIGVGDARCIPRWKGPLTVKVIVIDANKQPASNDLVQNVFNYIEEERPFGADVTVISANGKPINLSVALTLANGYTEAIAVGNIKKTITKYLQEIAFTSTSVSYAKIGSLIIDSEGVLDYQNLLINKGTTNIPIGNEEVAILGSVN
jgi:uncharacterized phage protein gp47/JayE